MNSIAGTCYVSANPAFTKNLFGPLSQIAGQRLKVIERNHNGDCLALLPDESNLVDVDHMDVVTFTPAPPSPFSKEWVEIISTLMAKL
jgi:hypothetical protein